MKIHGLIVAATALLAAPSAFAGLDCTGNFVGFDFHLTAPTASNKVGGPINIVVSQDGSVLRSTTMTPTSSAIVPNNSLSLQGTDGAGATLVLNATFANGAYTGTMTIGNSEGHATPTMTCKVN